jgi:hypothetical protein
MNQRTLLWAAAALLGIIATAAIAWTASQIAGQRIGISSEPLSVANHLAPRHTPAPRRPIHLPTKPAAPVVTVTQPAYSAPQPTYTPSAPAPQPTPSTAGSSHRDDGGDHRRSRGDD